MVGGSVAAAILFLMLFMHFVSAQSYITLDDAARPRPDGQDRPRTLDAKGIGYQIQNGGTALAVDSSQISQARIALATAGLLGGAASSPASSCSTRLSSAPPTSSSRSPTSARSRASSTRRSSRSRASTRRTGEPRAAQPAGPALRRQQATPRAPRCCCRRLRQPRPEHGQGHRPRSSPRASRACRPEGHDHRRDRRAALADLGAGGAGGADVASRRPSNRYDAQLAAASHRRLLAQTLGPGKAQVRRQRRRERRPDHLGHADLRQEGRAADPADPDRDAQGRRRRRRRHDRHDVQRRPTPRRGGGGKSNYNEHDRRRPRYGVDKTVTHTDVAPGRVKTRRLGAGRPVGPGRRGPGDQESGRERRRPQRQARRHDRRSARSPSPSRPPRRPPARAAGKMLGYAKYVLLGLGAPLFLFFMRALAEASARARRSAEPTLAARARGAARRLAAARGGHAERRPASGGCARTATSPQARRSRSSPTATPTASPSRCAPGCRRTSAARDGYRSSNASPAAAAAAAEATRARAGGRRKAAVLMRRSAPSGAPTSSSSCARRRSRGSRWRWRSCSRSAPRRPSRAQRDGRARRRARPARRGRRSSSRAR